MSSVSKASKAVKLYKMAMKTTTVGNSCKYHCDPTVRRIILEDALKLYNTALGAHAENDNLCPWRLAMCNNIGMAYLGLAQAYMATKAKNKNTNEIISNVNGCVKKLTLNWVWRPQDRELKWGSKVSGCIDVAFDVAFQSIGYPTEENWQKRLHQLDKVFKGIGPDSSLHRFRMRFLTSRAQFYSKSAAKIIESNKFELASRVIEYCRYDVGCANKYASQVEAPISAALLLQLQEVEDAITLLMSSGEYRRWWKEVKEERERKEAEKARGELAQELDELKNLKVDSFKLLKHIYAVHPPRHDTDFKFEGKKVHSGNIRKVLIKAIFHYHPDKQEQFEMKWQILCEEITKCLTLNLQPISAR